MTSGRKRKERPDDMDAIAAAGGAPDEAEAMRPLLIECRYGNELPKPPVPKLLRTLPSVERLCSYRTTSLEIDHRQMLLSEQAMMSLVELMDPSAYGKSAADSMAPPPPPQEAVLLKDDDLGEKVKEGFANKQMLYENTEAFHREAFGLQLPQLVTNDLFTERQRFITGMSAAEKKLHRDPPGYDGVEDLVSRIEKTFEDSKAEPVHPTNPNLKPKRVMPIVPDAVLWANRYRQVSFDELPQEPTVNDILLKTTPTPRATCFGYYAPGEGDGPEAGEYQLRQSYVWDNKGGFSKARDLGEDETLLLSFPPGGESGEVRFVMAPVVMKLKKQKAIRLDINLDTKYLAITHREPSAQEQAEERDRMATVLGDEGVERDESTFDFVDGEWKIRGLMSSRASGDGSQHGKPLALQAPPDSPKYSPK
eukprot:TRINITY_DN82354_c0_g1_i1.p1 TRINITY_DN82354_c0_g1~~TRINITY_DN82354_c0_g1_i1.p1  ORF type:complete len:422 (-),score=104.68 TRINITY_DN82354_c0_g1_i1:50-1315(-)